MGVHGYDYNRDECLVDGKEVHDHASNFVGAKPDFLGSVVALGNRDRRVSVWPRRSSHTGCRLVPIHYGFLN